MSEYYNPQAVKSLVRSCRQLLKNLHDAPNPRNVNKPHARASQRFFENIRESVEWVSPED